ncbi:hypothetical protein DXG03_005248 [Asterophora parasitica]|uniref:Uncharacterized protein n=1 Tax=Asterophora parasitica TaxID=117018 RepID=A0A9P7G640_9AGAR|nr:hypothetical protein DXG03_005248 [Asterophora parasitica]
MRAHRDQWIDAGNAEPHLLNLDTWRSRQDDPDDPQSMVGQWMEKLKYKRATPASTVPAAPFLERPITEWESCWFSWGTWKAQWADVDDEESVVGSLMRAHREQWYDSGKTDRHLLDLESWRSQWADPDDPDSLVYKWIEGAKRNREDVTNPIVVVPAQVVVQPVVVDMGDVEIAAVEASLEVHFATPLDDEALFLPLKYPPAFTLEDLGLDRFLPAADISFEDYSARSAAPLRPGFFGLNFTTPPKEKARMDAEIEAELKAETREERKARREKRARQKEE